MNAPTAEDELRRCATRAHEVARGAVGNSGVFAVGARVGPVLPGAALAFEGPHGAAP